jgi:hypothetical protein
MLETVWKKMMEVLPPEYVGIVATILALGLISAWLLPFLNDWLPNQRRHRRERQELEIIKLKLEISQIRKAVFPDAILDGGPDAVTIPEEDSFTKTRSNSGSAFKRAVYWFFLRSELSNFALTTTSVFGALALSIGGSIFFYQQDVTNPFLAIFALFGTPIIFLTWLISRFSKRRIRPLVVFVRNPFLAFALALLLIVIAAIINQTFFK